MERQYNNQEVQEVLTNLMRPEPTFIGIEGGPCGGKTTLVERAKERAIELGKELVVLPEVATQHIERLQTEGITIPWLLENDREGYLAFEAAILQDILAQRQAAKEAYAGQDVIVLSDRTDIKSYVTTDEYQQMCDELAINPTDALHGSDTLLYLPSVATVAPERYASLKATNASRYETLAEAQRTCQRNLSDIKTHPELHILLADDFEAAIEKGLGYIFAGDNEYEAKWTTATNAEGENLLWEIASKGNLLNHTHMSQSYHQAADGTNFRLRRGVGDDGRNYYHFSIKEKTPFGNREHRRTIDKATDAMLYENTETLGWLSKVRYSVLYQGQLWHCDQIENQDAEPFWIFEAEVSHPDELQKLSLPRGLRPSDFDTKQYAIDNLAKLANL